MDNPLIRLSKSVVGKAELQAVQRVLEEGFLGMGRETHKFESALKDYLGRSAVCVNTGTAALHLAVQAVTNRETAEILVQSLSYVASFQAITAAGATPVFCEVNPETMGIDLHDAEKRLNERTKAIMPVHYAGSTKGLSEVYAFARANSLRVIEDAAHAFGSRHENKKVGSFGDIACFSFDGIKNITSGEGGAVVTNDERIIQKVSDARLLGVEKDTEKRFKGERSWDFDVTEQGYRYHMSNIMAAIGIEQLKRLDAEFAPKRIMLAKAYTEMLYDTPGVKTFDFDYGEVVPHIFPIRITNGKRDVVRSALEERSIQSGVHYLPGHLLSFFGEGAVRLPVSEGLYKEILSIPLHPDLTLEDAENVVSCIKSNI